MFLFIDLIKNSLTLLFKMEEVVKYLLISIEYNQCLCPHHGDFNLTPSVLLLTLADS